MKLGFGFSMPLGLKLNAPRHFQVKASQPFQVKIHIDDVLGIRRIGHTKNLGTSAPTHCLAYFWLTP
ncbi:hypothetical protein F0562_014295 [Nyssa sinensis]|uniref:Uncharacterized protein n=1 Tax=Nyssa sinensis TaxID=561372 RepID=A0A5J4ZSI1_9ASTE|nr:hypothetical protein F0562_014295 [Nyssa sinensis]